MYFGEAKLHYLVRFNRFLDVTDKRPEEVTIDPLKGTWSVNGGEPRNIGEAVSDPMDGLRVMTRNPENDARSMATIYGVFDPAILSHARNMIYATQMIGEEAPPVPAEFA